MAKDANENFRITEASKALILLIRQEGKKKPKEMQKQVRGLVKELDLEALYLETDNGLPS